MSDVNFKLEKVIAGTVMSRYQQDNYKENKYGGGGNQSSIQRPSLTFGCTNTADVNGVGRTTTYDIVGKRDYEQFYNNKKFKF